MSGSMYAAISGLSADQSLLGVVSENIANANTAGYKAGSMTFAQAMQQTLSGASAPTATIGGINPVQLAAGGAVNVAGVQINTNEGTLQSTGINTNLAIQGQGYFVVKTSQGGLAYTRAGNFSLDANGNLVDPSGDRVLGWKPSIIQAKAQTGTNMSSLTVQPGTNLPAQASQNISSIAGNLNSSDAKTATASNPVSIPVTLYDALGNEVPVNLTFAPSGTPSSTGGVTWNVGYSYQPSGSTSPTTGTLGTLNFPAGGGAGTYTSSGSISITPTDGSAPLTVKVPASAFTNLTGYAMATSIQATADGNQAGTLQNFTIGSDGSITGSFSNGGTKVLGQVALADFTNPAGLQNIGQSLWQQSPNSGSPLVGTASSGQLGSLAAGEVEGSNVSLANEFVNMIIAQQGYQANAKVITVAQTLRQTMVNMIQ